MLFKNLDLELAECQLQQFEHDDPVLRDHREAEDYWRCEEFLKVGIEAYKFLSRAEEAFIVADVAGIAEYSAELQSFVKALYGRWLATCPSAVEWINRLSAQGHDVENRKAFLACVDLVQDWTERDHHCEFGKSAAEERYRAEQS